MTSEVAGRRNARLPRRWVAVRFSIRHAERHSEEFVYGDFATREREPAVR